MNTTPGLSLRKAALSVAERLIASGHEAWFVGGCVRDALLNLPLKDIDIVTDARPERMLELFPRCKFVGQKFGVSMVRVGEHEFEVATFRRDGQYLNHRHPESVEYGTMEQDAARRDFTMNALYQHPLTGEVKDLVGGMADLRAGVLRCVGNPRRRFHEDALRLLRAVRFAARFGFSIDPDTWQAVIELAPTIEYISPERHREELTRMLTGPNPSRAIRLMDECGLLHFLLPEVEAMKGVEQGREFHPEGDVFVHTLLVLENTEPRTPITAWGALLHDVGKPPTFARDPETGKISFYEHQFVGAKMARVILERLKFSNDDADRICAIVERHMQFMNVQQMRQSTLRRFLSSETIADDLVVHRADVLGSNGRLDYYDFCRAKLKEFEEARMEVVPKPFLNGHELQQLGFKPGPALGALLREMLDRQLEGEITSKEEAEEWAKARLMTGGKDSKDDKDNKDAAEIRP